MGKKRGAPLDSGVAVCKADVATAMVAGLQMLVVPVRPPLKWAGGKRWLVPDLAKLWNGHESRRLVEPFCGGLAVALSLRPKRALLNDINPHAVNFYSWLKRGLRVN
ncbi:MAG TPA: DNA adenine methylase, partial [Candidatus Binataceae bacterium]|nr:DNA adenine methylase [Candidatus Binataceae bacterium]